MTVDYRGLQRIDITIPENATSIPLGQINDFANVVFNVTNHSKDTYLFTYVNNPDSIRVTGKDIDRGLFINQLKLNKGRNILVIEDKNPWVVNRKNHSYGHQRKDILLIENGKAKNKTIMPYDNDQSTPICKYYTIIYPFIQLSGLTLNRTAESSSKTYLCKIIGADNVRLNNIIINTPSSVIVGDVAINIRDCTRVRFEDITINGTYSQPNHSGYGITMNNVWCFRAKRLFGTGNWGIFGNNNINNTFIENSKINRFDIHCYGRDVSFKNVEFVDLYNQFSSVFGTIRFDKCAFKHFVPVLYETSYNAYTPHDVVFNRCEFHLDAKRNYLFSAGRLGPEVNNREELKEKSWPNVNINKMVVHIEDETDHFYLFNCAVDPHFYDNVQTIESVVINDVSFKYSTPQFPITIELSNKKINTEKTVYVKVNKVVAGPDSRITLPFNTETGKTKVFIRRSSISNVIND